MFRNCFAFVKGQGVPSTVPAEIVALGFDTAKAEERRDREKNRGRIFEMLYMIISYLFGDGIKKKPRTKDFAVEKRRLETKKLMNVCRGFV
jgi:hypothetical protein